MAFRQVDVTVVPAYAGTHNHRLWNMGSRFRGNDTKKRGLSHPAVRVTTPPL